MAATRLLKIESVTSDYIMFTDFTFLRSYHHQDCCEQHFIDFSVMSNYNLDTKTGKILNIYDREFDFTDGIPFKRVENMGVLLFDTTGNFYLLNGYGSNNGYYSDEILLQYCGGDGEVIFEEDVSECQVLD